MHFHVFLGQIRLLICLQVSFHTTGVFITMFKYSCWLKMCLRSDGFVLLNRYFPVLWRFTWEQTLLEGVCVLVHCTYFLTGSSVTMMVVHVSHGPDSEPPQRVTLGPAWDWTRDQWIWRSQAGYQTFGHAFTKQRIYWPSSPAACSSTHKIFVAANGMAKYETILQETVLWAPADVHQLNVSHFFAQN